MKYIMRCTRPGCTTFIGDDEKGALVCPACESPLTINIVHDKVNKIDETFFTSRTTSMWKFLPFLPLKHPGNIVSLGEGATPLLRAKNLASFFKRDVLLKNEAGNPTGSFLDRNVSMGISAAKELGFTKAISLSTGNVGASVSAYAARGGFKSLVIVPQQYRAGKIHQIQLYGGNVLQVQTDSERDLMAIVTGAAKEFKAINMATTALYNAFTNHGAKTIIYEIFEQHGLSLPDLVVVPVGGAGLLCALIQACMELKELAFVDHVPDFIAVQPEGCHPFIDAIATGATPEEVYARPITRPTTEISALAYDVPFDYAWYHQLRRQLSKDIVHGITVSDAEARAARKSLSKNEGLFVELASATTLAALTKLREGGNGLDRYDAPCLILTGTGLLDVEQATRGLPPPETHPFTGFDWKASLRTYLG